MQTAWRLFDCNGTGYLEVCELLAILTAADLGFSLGALQKILKRVARPPAEPRPSASGAGASASTSAPAPVPFSAKWRVALADVLASDAT